LLQEGGEKEKKPIQKGGEKEKNIPNCLDRGKEKGKAYIANTG